LLLNSLAGDNPQGWQRVAGGRSGQRGNDHRKTALDGPASRRGVPEPWRHDRSNEETTTRPFTRGHAARTPHRKYLGSISSGLSTDESGTPAGVQEFSCAAARRSPPKKPSATSGYPLATLRVDRSGMSKPQCSPPYRRFPTFGSVAGPAQGILRWWNSPGFISAMAD
jgi:hypothetical protein